MCTWSKLSLFPLCVRFTALLLPLVHVQQLSGQNLFPNPDFELFNSCPVQYSGINTNNCTDWTCIAGSPDYYNCSFYGSSGGGIFGVPSTGSGVVGMWGLINNLFCNGQLQRESIAATLLEPIGPCHTYRLSFDLRIDRGYGHPCLDFGFYFYSGINPNACSNSCGCWTVTPQVTVSSAEIPYHAYQTFTVEFTPTGTFNKVAIGPFCNDLMNLPECYAAPQNHGPFQLYYNLDNLHLEKIQTVPPVILVDHVACQGDTVVIVADGLHPDHTYNWEVSGGELVSTEQGSASYVFPLAGNFSILLIDQGACTQDTITAEIHVAATDLSRLRDTTITLCRAEVFQPLFTATGVEYSWSDGHHGAVRSFPSPGRYLLRGADASGCFMDSAHVQVSFLEGLVVRPNPTRDNWSISEPLPLPNHLQLWDGSGRIVYEARDVRTLDLVPHDLSILPGMYILRIHAGACTLWEKLIHLR
jgi:hypothetical protein